MTRNTVYNMTRNTVIILFRLAWELAKAVHVARRNMTRPQKPEAEPLIVACAPKMPALHSQAALARCNERTERTEAQLQLGDRITRQMITVGGLMQAYARCTTISAYMQNDERGQQELILDIFKVENRRRGRTLIGPFSRQ